jgi:hypothetical protein
MDKILKISDIRKPLTFNIQKGMGLHYLSSIADGKYGMSLDFDVYLPSKGKNLQRKLCWKLQQKQELVISVLKGIALPSLSVIIHEAEDGKRTHKIIDGKQRLSSLISFYKGEFPLSVDGNDYYFKDLEPLAQTEIKLLHLTADLAYEYWDAMISDDDKIAWFEMINFAGTPQDAEHLKNLKS